MEYTPLLMLVSLLALALASLLLVTSEQFDQYDIRYNRFLGSNIPWRDRTEIDSDVNFSALKEPSTRDTLFRYIRLTE